MRVLSRVMQHPLTTGYVVAVLTILLVLQIVELYR